jgi:cytochrome b subunit of formate dehydrogenase
MTALLVGTLTFFGLHTLLWLPRSIRYRKEIKAMEAAHGGEPQVWVRRFKKYNVRLHRMVIISFFALAITGMTLKFSYTGWAHVLARMLGGFEGAGLIHRIAAGVTFLYFVLHIGDLLRKKLPEAGSLKNLILGPNSMMPNKRDGIEFIGSVKWFLGKGPRPEYGRWTYWEKFDYLAVFWGVAVIGLTGLLLWFAEFFTRFIPGPVLNIATIIHSDEALLAVGFIFTIHFFNTHFRPEKFPMDPVIFTGRVPLEEFKIDRPREYRELVESGRLEEHLVGPPEKESLRGWKIFGFTALGIGIIVIFLIIYGSVVAYQ